MTTEGHRPPRVFVSYAYDSEQHKQHVHNFARLLREQCGIDVRFDQWDADRRRDWSIWIIDQLQNADYVLVIASPAYKRRAEGSAAASDGRGVQFEAALLRDMLTKDRTTWMPKVLPVVLPGRSIDEIPAFLQPYSASHYIVDTLTTEGIDQLYRTITRQPRHHTPKLGHGVVQPSLTGSPPPNPSTDRPWHPGQDIRVGDEHYLAVAVDSEELAQDGSWVRRQVLARRPRPPAHLVVLRQVRVLIPNDAAERQRAALLTERALLADMADVTGIPHLLDHESHQDAVTLVLNRPDAPGLRDLYGPPQCALSFPSRLESARTIGFLRIMHQLCRPLQALHERQLSHRALTPETVLLADNGRTPVLRDVGLAALAPTRAEGVPPYQAPEQRHPGRYSTMPDIHTDVFQLAMIIYHTITGDIPSGNSPLASISDARLHPQLTQLLADALSPMPDRRPRDAATFGAALARAASQ